MALPSQRKDRHIMSGFKVGVALFVFVTSVALLTACNDADVASSNLSQDADNFKINRRIVFFNGITDTYLLSIEGFCSIKDENKQLEVTYKTDPGTYKKHFLGLSDNVSYFVEQMDSTKVDAYHYKVVFKPDIIAPDIEIRTSVSNDSE